MQGDQYHLRIRILDKSGNAIDSNAAESVEFIVGGIRKVYPGDACFSDGYWLVPMTQQETMTLKHRCDGQIRVKFAGGDVRGAILGPLLVSDSSSKEVL